MDPETDKFGEMSCILDISFQRIHLPLDFLLKYKFFAYRSCFIDINFDLKTLLKSAAFFVLTVTMWGFPWHPNIKILGTLQALSMAGLRKHKNLLVINPVWNQIVKICQKDMESRSEFSQSDKQLSQPNFELKNLKTFLDSMPLWS